MVQTWDITFMHFQKQLLQFLTDVAYNYCDHWAINAVEIYSLLHIKQYVISISFGKQYYKQCMCVCVQSLSYV